MTTTEKPRVVIRLDPKGGRAMTFVCSVLREARARMGLSQSQLAALVGCHVTSVSDWERGAAVPTTRSLIRLSRTLGVTMEELTTWSPRKEFA